MLPLLLIFPFTVACSFLFCLLSFPPSSSISCLSLFPCLCPLPCLFQKIHLRPVLFLFYRSEAFGDCSFCSVEGEGPCRCVLWPVLSIKSAGAAYLELACGPGGAGSMGQGGRLPRDPWSSFHVPFCLSSFILRTLKKTHKNTGKDKE